jgi:hypothetical protein
MYYNYFIFIRKKVYSYKKFNILKFFFLDNINLLINFKKKNILNFINFKKRLYSFFIEINKNELFYRDLLLLKKYENIYTIIEKHYDYFFIFLSFMYKKNKYAPFIFSQELTVVPELFNTNNFYLIETDIEVNKKIM